MLHKPFLIRSASWQADRARLEFVRRRVFIVEQKIPESEEWDDADENSSHVLAFSEKRDAVGTGRLEPTGKIARLAVLGEYRGQGVGSAMLIRLVEEARQRDFDQVYLHAQTHALNFYKKFGFVSDEEIFSEGGIPHVLARLDL
ncbi:MAG: GNAT family N-acetyltransferase [Proteobacteria bacterium]|nr:GNAT family N-acetyltransferase [Pseudomonadota bacterium]